MKLRRKFKKGIEYGALLEDMRKANANKVNFAQKNERNSLQEINGATNSATIMENMMT